MKQADLVITGEGRIDFQSALGKVPVGVAERAKKVRNVPVVAIAGMITSAARMAASVSKSATFDADSGIFSLSDK